MRLGNIAEGDDFFARTRELEDFWRYLEDNHVALTGPRRLGKSSLLKRLSEQALEQGVMARLIDVEGLDTAMAFIQAVEQAYPDASVSGFIKAAGDKVGAWVGRVKKVGINLPGGFGGGSLELQDKVGLGWNAQAQRLQMRLSEAPVLIVVDEFSVFLEKLLKRDANEGEMLLGWLRAWRQSAKVSRWVFSGSVGINALLERHQLSTRLNDCYDFALGPFRLDESRTMLVELARRDGWVLTQDVADYLSTRVGWRSPFYLNLLLDESRKAARDRMLEMPPPAPSQQEVQTGDIDDAYDRLLATRSRFIHWYQRLGRDLLAAELDFSLAVLSHSAKMDQGIRRDQLLARLARLEKVPERRAQRLSRALLYLEEQGYLSEREGCIQFPSFLLRDYWRRNHAH